MAGIAHLSDIHFGAHDPRIVAATEAWLQARQPDLVIISGDFTQRARIGQFREASAYVNRLRAAGHNLLVVPGNHDVPLYDVVRRFAAPLRRYKRFISNDLCPWFENDEISVLGINTARALTIKDGRINHEQIALMKQRFAAVGASKTRILVTHHPLFSMPIGAGGELSEAVGRHEEAVEGACEAGVHLALAGHFHRTYAEAARKVAERAGSAIIIQAGTATSTRLRNAEPQSFNWLEVRRNDHFSLQVIAWNGTSYAKATRSPSRTTAVSGTQIGSTKHNCSAPPSNCSRPMVSCPKAHIRDTAPESAWSGGGERLHRRPAIACCGAARQGLRSPRDAKG